MNPFLDNAIIKSNTYLDYRNAVSIFNHVLCELLQQQPASTPQQQPAFVTYSHPLYQQNLGALTLRP